MPHTRHFLDRAPFTRMKEALILEKGPQGITVRFMGTGVVAAWAEDWTGRDFLETVPPEHRPDAKHAFAIAAVRPSGFTVRLTTTTLQGRTIHLPVLVLPLRVDPDKPSRTAVHFQLPAMDTRDLLTTLQWNAEPRWIDIGFGAPLSAVRRDP